MHCSALIFARLVFIATLVAGVASVGHAADSVNWWLTSIESGRLTPQSQPLAFAAQTDSPLPSIQVDPAQRFQSIDGFGFALTGGSAQHLIAMSPAQRAMILQELFSTQGYGIGISYLRLSVGASDLNERVFSYDDLPADQTDPKLEHFNLSEDRTNVVPVLKEILAINPKIKILASPWSAPVWMKTNHKVQGGKLKPECYPTLNLVAEDRAVQPELQPGAVATFVW